mmetsp:Transcript_10385/g.20381  ORF Transcript_10385/g.20381 Transcript_10385/m.20381 type:complete len:271 (+) Transcript_10385:197-1009(+)|eukprot:CAMPEP_0173389204 /NCGR_PEP_ID=MMETSP1356-20130122/11346_1 /TAXON_ID=77927 ORGANISM="Hemiselmis virescens, Strain PCC157" /NCGR_SAMPLE_ID=MMETSP1356 /ASSEMBLY_ACC=CAM_ASM_000847 /LENGTH=270 /DNA_ID=CAMNT_0014346301 /DNA_START=180 /DNA_END=992 /DNA_ORIENTATION=+
MRSEELLNGEDGDVDSDGPPSSSTSNTLLRRPAVGRQRRGSDGCCGAAMVLKLTSSIDVSPGGTASRRSLSPRQSLSPGLRERGLSAHQSSLGPPSSSDAADNDPAWQAVTAEFEHVYAQYLARRTNRRNRVLGRQSSSINIDTKLQSPVVPGIPLALSPPLELISRFEPPPPSPAFARLLSLAQYPPSPPCEALGTAAGGASPPVWTGRRLSAGALRDLEAFNQAATKNDVEDRLLHSRERPSRARDSVQRGDSGANQMAGKLSSSFDA